LPFLTRRKRCNYFGAKPVTGHIYLIKSEHGYKIGKTKNLSQRLSTFGLKLPFPIKLIHALRSNDISRCEWHFHDYFKRKRINGEWFRLTDEDVRFFCVAGTSEGVGELFYVEPTPNLSDYK
jgi:hypothetical protein